MGTDDDDDRPADPFDDAPDDTPVTDDPDRTPTVQNPCPDCGHELVMIATSPPPEVTAEIWLTIFASRCVKSPLWRWCAQQGHLSVRVTRP